MDTLGTGGDAINPVPAINPSGIDNSLSVVVEQPTGYRRGVAATFYVQLAGTNAEWLSY